MNQEFILKTIESEKDLSLKECELFFYYEFKDLQEDLSILKDLLKPSEYELSLYNRFKDKLNNLSNFLTPEEKNNIIKTDLYLKEDYKGILELLK